MTTIKLDEPWNGICINGQEFKTIHYTDEPKQGEAIRLGPFPCGSAPETSGTYTFTAQMEITEEDAAIFDEICGTRTQQEPGEPQVDYREDDKGAIWRSAGGVQNLHVNELGPLSGKAWEQIGTSRGRPRSDRLRKFVWRRGQLAEVRTRGRTGVRSLRAAIEAAGMPSEPITPYVFRVDLVLEAIPLIKMPIGLRSAPRLTCDVCEMQFPGDQVGSSFVHIPDSDISTEDMRERCARCTEQHGPLASPPAGGIVGAKLETTQTPPEEDTDGINF